MDWSDLAEVQQFVADRLMKDRDDRLYRAVCGRAYYSAYAAITSHIPPGTTFAHGWQNPPHEALPRYLDRIGRLSATKKDAIRVALSQLRHRREDADYRPSVAIDRTTARESLRGLRTIPALLP